jgi:hypothetical protein
MLDLGYQDCRSLLWQLAGPLLLDLALDLASSGTASRQLSEFGVESVKC